METDAENTVTANTAKCQNVLMNLLRSEHFALLCGVLCRTVHQDEERTRYFDFGLIDSRMKNGNYGHEPELFMHDLKLVIASRLFWLIFLPVLHHPLGIFVLLVN